MPNKAQLLQTDSDRRKFKRARFLMSGILISGDHAIQCVILDLSVNGARIKTPQPTEPSSAVKLNLAGSVELNSEVMWRKGNELGIRFTDEPEEIGRIMAGLLPRDCLTF